MLHDFALAQAAVQRHEAPIAEEQYAALRPYASSVIPTGTICADRLLGLLTQTIGDLDTAQLHFEDALAFCRKAGYRPELAWSLCDYADMLLGRDTEDDRGKAVALLDESLAISSELGMRPLTERVQSMRETLNA